MTRSLLQRPFPPVCQQRGGSCSLKLTEQSSAEGESRMVVIKLKFTGNGLLSIMALLWCGTFFFGIEFFFQLFLSIFVPSSSPVLPAIFKLAMLKLLGSKQLKGQQLFYLFDSGYRNLKSSHWAPRNFAFFRLNDGSTVVTFLMPSLKNHIHIQCLQEVIKCVPQFIFAVFRFHSLEISSRQDTHLCGMQ